MQALTHSFSGLIYRSSLKGDNYTYYVFMIIPTTMQYSGASKRRTNDPLDNHHRMQVYNKVAAAAVTLLLMMA